MDKTTMWSLSITIWWILILVIQKEVREALESSLLREESTKYMMIPIIIRIQANSHLNLFQVPQEIPLISHLRVKKNNRK